MAHPSRPTSAANPLADVITPLLLKVHSALSPVVATSPPSPGNDTEIDSSNSDSFYDDAPLLRTASTSGKYPNILPSVVAQRHRRRVPSILELSMLNGPDLTLRERIMRSLHRKCVLGSLTIIIPIHPAVLYASFEYVSSPKVLVHTNHFARKILVHIAGARAA